VDQRQGSGHPGVRETLNPHPRAVRPPVSRNRGPYAVTMIIPNRGDIGLAKGGGAAMALVRWGTGGRKLSWGRFWRIPAKYGHAAVCVGLGPSPDEVIIVEATPAGVIKRNVPITHFDWSTGGPFDAQLTEEVRGEIVYIALGYLGKRYDWPSIASFLRRWVSLEKYQGREAGDGHLFCSELCVRAWRGAGVKGLFDGLPPGPRRDTPRTADGIAPVDLMITQRH
jgi:hypothetical protein